MNIDKDIELVSNLKNVELKEKVNEQYIYIKIPEEYLKAIENVLAEFEELKEDNYAYHQLMRMQNQREYRSKFLKDFKKEFGENVMPDYDEIYKRYDKQKKAIETWKKMAEKLAEELDKITEEVAREKGIHYVCKFCNSCSDIECQQCIINWARKEVKK